MDFDSSDFDIDFDADTGVPTDGACLHLTSLAFPTAFLLLASPGVTLTIEEC